MKIPIENLYFLLIYAWDRLEEAGIVDVNPRDYTRLMELFGRVLNNGINRLIRRGLDREYIDRSSMIPGVRGKFDVGESVKSLCLMRGRAVCEFDELNHNVLHNMIIKATLRRLVHIRDLDHDLRDSLLNTYRRLDQIADIPLSSGVYRRVQLHRNNRFYAFLLEICRLIQHNLLIDEDSGKSRFRDFERQEKTMAALFEKFVRNFYKREQSVFDVKSEPVQWQETSGTPEAIKYLPIMRTDISLTCPARKIVIDTKFYYEAMREWRGKRSVRSDHLCQLFTYVKNLDVCVAPGQVVEGMLLYPTVSEQLDLAYEMHGHQIRVRTIDLNQDWRAIREDMLQLISD